MKVPLLFLPAITFICRTTQKSGVSSTIATGPLTGIASHYPGDLNVLYMEKSDNGMPSILRRYNDVKDKWYNNPNDQPFQGFRWCADSNVNINWPWFEFYHENPNAPSSYIKFDNLVIAKNTLVR
ncbi:MAG: hypothetical protein JSS70_07985 [Bacteroidetes bacterium]|nr:hypothetical protein [Bacteroidota bacterium]